MPSSSSTPPKNAAEGPHREIVCPADLKIVGTVKLATREDVAAAAVRLRAAQPAWEALGARGRAVWLGRWRDWMLDHDEELLRLVQRESGKSWGDASLEIQIVMETINHYADAAERALAPQRPPAHGLTAAAKAREVVYFPHCLVGVITPWNYPLGMPMLDIPAALVAGCAVLSKPSEATPLAWTRAVEGWAEIGAPLVLDVVNGEGEVGAAVVDVVDMVQFTGSVRTGRRIAVAAAERLIPASLELGGKDAMIVLDSADLERAVRGAVWGGFFNSGQSCVSVERIYVEERIYERFVEQLADRVGELRQGMDGVGAFGCDIGAMATQAQLEFVERQVDDALANGARAVAGGKRGRSGLFYEPTVLVDVDHSMDVMRDETFGPVVGVMRVADAGEALRLANDSPYGLSGSIWTADTERARALADEFETGAVNVNDVMVNVFQFGVPQSGWKDSGVGHRFGGAAGIQKFCRVQSRTIPRLRTKTEPHWYPYNRRRSMALARVARLLGARDWRRRLR